MNNLKKNKEQVDALQNLLQKTYDAKAGYKQVMTKAENEPLKNWLQKKATHRSRFANELDARIRSFNETPISEGSVLGSTHRTWIDIKAAMSSNTDEAILEECIRGEKATLEEYNTQMERIKFNPEIQSVLQEQREHVTSDLKLVKSLEDIVS